MFEHHPLDENAGLVEIMARMGPDTSVDAHFDALEIAVKRVIDATSDSTSRNGSISGDAGNGDVGDDCGDDSSITQTEVTSRPEPWYGKGLSTSWKKQLLLLQIFSHSFLWW